MSNEEVAVGFNTSPNCRQEPSKPVDGVLHIVAFDTGGNLKAIRDVPYLADGNGELVADGEALPGPGGTLVVRLQSVNLDPEGAQESKSGVLLLDPHLHSSVEIDRFLEQTTLTDHAIVFQEGTVFSGPRTYDVLDGMPLKQIGQRQIDWPVGTRDRKFGEHGFAFMLCEQELSPGKYTRTNIIYSGANARCSIDALAEDGSNWEQQLQAGETAGIVGLLGDGGVVGQVNRNNTEELVVWHKGGQYQSLAWLSNQFHGSVDSASGDFSRYGSVATTNPNPCNALTRILGICDQNGQYRWFIFDRDSRDSIVTRPFPKEGRAAISPDGLHYASFEAGELRVYSLPSSR